METVYIETSIVSYLVADPSRDLLTAANQQVTRDWWQRQRAARRVFRLFRRVRRNAHAAQARRHAPRAYFALRRLQTHR